MHACLSETKVHLTPLQLQQKTMLPSDDKVLLSSKYIQVGNHIILFRDISNFDQRIRSKTV